MNPGGGEIFRTCPDWPWGPPSLLYNGYRVFPGGKERPGRDADPSPTSSAVGHERVELYLYSSYGPYGLYRACTRVTFTFNLFYQISRQTSWHCTAWPRQIKFIFYECSNKLDLHYCDKDRNGQGISVGNLYTNINTLTFWHPSFTFKF